MRMKLASEICSRVLVALFLVVASAIGCSSGDATTAKLVSIAITPASPSVAVGGTQQLTATGTYSDQSKKDLTASATWTSAATATATVSAGGLATGVAAGTATISAASGGVTGTVTITVTSANVTLVSIDVAPAAPSVAVGATQQFSATGHYNDGSMHDLTGTATWTSATTATATISSGGLATAVAQGTSMISAASGGVTGSTTLTVIAPPMLTSIAVTPATPSIAKGTTEQFVATGSYSDGSTKDLSATATWTSATTATATISATGLATGVTSGTSLISAASGGVTGSTTLTVTGASLVSIAVTPPTPSIAAGTTEQFVATGTFQDGTNPPTTQDISSMVTWTSGTPATATISTAGLATGKAMGTTVVSAASNGITGMTTLTVRTPDLVSIDVTPAAPTIANGTTTKFTATGKFSDQTTQDLSSQVTWSSATPGVATISTLGVATGVSKGTTTISAKLGTITGPTVLTVSDATLVSIAVSVVLPVPGAAPKIAKNTSAQLIATGTYTDKTTQDLTTQVTWASDTQAVLTVSNAAGSKGLASATGMTGAPMVSATLGTGATAVTGKLTVTVTGETLVSIGVAPDPQTIAAGTTLQYVARGFFSDSSQQFVTALATWSSGTATTASISNAAGSKGLAKGLAAGTSVIKAAIGTINDTATLKVTDAIPTSIAITPPTPTLALGMKLNLVATATMSDQSKQDVTGTVTWSSATTTIATVSNAAATAGQVSPVAKGTSVVTATYTIAAGQTVSATVTVTVTDVALKSIAVSAATSLTIEKGTTLQLVATGTYTDDSTKDITKEVTWSSGKAAVATVSNVAGSIGLATAVATGTASISATSSPATGSIVGSATLTVNDGNLTSIAVTPAAPSIAAGTKLQLVATGTYDDGAQQDITADVDWASDTKAAATVDAAGLAAGVAPGTAKITASLKVGTATLAGSTSLTVTNVQLMAINVDPHPTWSIAKGTTAQFKATGFFSDFSQQDLTDSVTWGSSKPAFANISNAADSNGLATGLAEGTTNITASLVTPANGTVTSAAVALTVTKETLVSLAITPPTPSVARGARINLVATGTFTDGSKQDLTNAVTWASAMTTIATVENANNTHGRVTGVAMGTADVTATSSAASGAKVAHITVTVTAPVVATIAVTPANAAIAKTHTQQYAAQATLTDGTKQDVTATATWASTVTTTATISASGVATGVAAGTTQITAAANGVTSNKATLTVN